MRESEAIAAPCEIIDEHPRGDVGVDEGKGNDIARCDQRLGNAFVRSASAAIAGNLRNLERRQLRLGVLARVAQQFVRNLPWGW